MQQTNGVLIDNKISLQVSTYRLILELYLFNWAVLHNGWKDQMLFLGTKFYTSACFCLIYFLNYQATSRDLTSGFEACHLKESVSR